MIGLSHTYPNTHWLKQILVSLIPFDVSAVVPTIQVDDHLALRLRLARQVLPDGDNLLFNLATHNRQDNKGRSKYLHEKATARRIRVEQ